MTRVIAMSRAPRDWQDRDEFVYVGRSGKGFGGYFGNPFRLEREEQRGATIERFEAYARERVATDANYRQAVRDLSGKTLICFCKPLACHGDVLARIADELVGVSVAESLDPQSALPF